MNENILIKLILKILAGVMVLVAGYYTISGMVTTVNADEIVIKQNVLDGQLQVWTTPGVHWSNFGIITRYKRSDQFWFSAKKDEGKDIDESIKVRFNDGAHAQISGSMRYNLPLDYDKMIILHRTYGSMAAVRHELVRQVANKSIYMSAPLMSSRESYAEKRSDLINFITDQIINGVYRTERHQSEVADVLTGQKKTVDFVIPKSGAGPNGLEREEESPFLKFNMTAYNITINSIDYDATVEEQIKKQQQSFMDVQQAIVNAKKAEQDSITIKMQGEAAAAKAKWDQEIVKATEITKAQQQKEVAALELDTAKLAAEKTITEARADADAKKLAMQANNYAIEKLEAYKAIAIAQANALGAQRQTPDIQLGGSGGAQNTASLMDILAAKTARDLGVSTK